MLPLIPGDPRRISRYAVHGRLGAGGMGIVYAATDPDGHQVAVKVVRREFADDQEFRTRFSREVAVLRRVRGVCVAPVLAADTDAEQPWFATDFLSGPDLKRYVAEHGPLSGPELTAFAAGVAEALISIHAAGVVHRDLKPANVILSPDGPRVLDFGIAHAVDATALTRTGMVTGSVGWLSPEQYRGDPATPAGDVFTWGSLVAFAATGRLPFAAERAEAVALRVMTGEPDLAGVPSDVLPAVRAALAKDPAQRPHARGLLQGLTGSAADPQTEVTRVLRRDWHPATDRQPAWPAAKGGRRLQPWHLVASSVAVLTLGAGIVVPLLLREDDPKTRAGSDGPATTASASATATKPPEAAGTPSPTSTPPLTTGSPTPSTEPPTSAPVTRAKADPNVKRLRTQVEEVNTKMENVVVEQSSGGVQLLNFLIQDCQTIADEVKRKDPTLSGVVLDVKNFCTQADGYSLRRGDTDLTMARRAYTTATKALDAAD